MSEQRDNEGSSADHLGALESVALDTSRSRIERVLEVARDLLNMEISYLAQIKAAEQVVIGVDGAFGALEVEPGATVPLEETYCRRMLDEEIPSAIPDTLEQPAISDLAFTQGLGTRAYIGVPVQMSDGSIFGTFCCASQAAHPELNERDERFMRVLARLLADELELLERTAPATPAPGDNGATARLTLWFAGAPKAAPAARKALQSLADQLTEATLQTMNLLVTELVTNSVRHAGIGPTSSVGLEVTVTEERVRAVVSDPGPGFDPDVTEPDVMDEGGRGLFLVEQLAEGWGVEQDNGASVWFELVAP